MELRSRLFFQIGLDAFYPFNDAPAYLAGQIDGTVRDGFRVSGEARYQMVGWHKIGLRSQVLTPHSFTFSVDARPRAALGAYSIGIHADKDNLPAINISHFLRSSTTLLKSTLGGNFFSGWSYDLDGHRSQEGVTASWAALDQHHNLSVSYDVTSKTLSCAFNGFVLHEVVSELGPFHLVVRFEAVGVEGAFDVEFENASYFSYDSDVRNVLPLKAWNPQYAPVFVSYSHADANAVRPIIERLRSDGVRVMSDWDFRIGDSLIDRISNAIERSGYLVVMLSPASVASTWVQRELQIAIDAELARRNVKVLPVIVEPCEIPSFLRGKVWVESDSSDFYETMLRTLGSLGRW